MVWSKEQEFGAQTQDLLHVDEIIQNRPGVKTASSYVGNDPERRAVPRNSTAQAHELSRHLSSTVQFGFLALIGLSLAGAAAAAVRKALEAPLAVVAAKL